MWLRDYHVDGLRLDAVHAIVDDSAVHVLERARASRSTRSPPHVRPAAVPHRRERPQRPALRAQPRRRRLRARRRLGRRVAPRAARRAHRRAGRLLRGLRLARARSPRRCARRGCTTAPGRRTASATTVARPRASSGHQFVVCTQNHDQVGNRAAGERTQRAHRATAALRVAAALLLTGPFTPMLFQGEEWGASRRRSSTSPTTPTRSSGRR